MKNDPFGFRELKKLALLFLTGLGMAACSRTPGGTGSLLPADSKRLDHPLEAGWMFASAPAGRQIQAPGSWRGDIFDYTDYRAGDFSIRQRVSEQAAVFGFTPGPSGRAWDLSGQDTLVLWIKAEGKGRREGWRLVLTDTAGRSASCTVEGCEPDGTWRELYIPLTHPDTATGFGPGGIRSIQFEPQLEPGSMLWFDDVRLMHPGKPGHIIGISDKSIRQRMKETAGSRDLRVRKGFEKIVREDEGNSLDFYFARLWLGLDLAGVNRDLRNIFTTKDPDISRRYEIHNKWSLHLNPMLCRLYFNFGSMSKIKPGRLEPETEKALLDLLWERMLEMNDIHLARQSSWWITGSENHDINAKAAALLSSQIFMHEPDYAGRNYPDPGTGGGHSYWFHQMYGQGRNTGGPEGRGLRTDTGTYTAAGHYREWLSFWNEFLTERARKGFFLEVASSGYMRHTINFLQDVYDYTDDPELKRRMKMFLDLVWAEWAQDQLGACRGGAKTRWRRHGFDAMWEQAGFYLGGPGGAGRPLYWQLSSDYAWPEIVWRMALDRRGKGEYAYISRKPGEEEPGLWPRPGGLERTMATNTEARFVRYSWVTPDYILGTQMDHPAATHSHLSPAGRWQGMSFSSDFTASVSPCGIVTPDSGNWKRELHSYYRSVQYRNVLITQQNRRWFQQNPDWYPTYDIYDRTFGIFFDGEFDSLEEENGWIFIREGNAYLAVRPVMGEYEYDYSTWVGAGREGMLSGIRRDTYDWGPDRRFIKFRDRYSPVIMEAGRQRDYPSLEAFKVHIISTRLELHKTVVPGWYILVYGSGTEESPEIYFNAANNEIPKVNGKYLEYAPAYTFKSPFIFSDYNSGVITLQVDANRETWDFNKGRR